jgi:predicted N-acetyltransferase YhbS
MEIEIATIQDVPALLDLQRKAFGPLCEELDWTDAPPLKESLEHANEEFVKCTTLKVQNNKGQIIGSVNGNVTDGSLYIGRLMVLPEYQQQGIGKQLFRDIQSRLPHSRAWLCTCQQVRPTYEFYLREGFRPYKDETVGPGLTWVYMEKRICLFNT